MGTSGECYQGQGGKQNRVPMGSTLAQPFTKAASLEAWWGDGHKLSRHRRAYFLAKIPICLGVCSAVFLLQGCPACLPAVPTPTRPPSEIVGLAAARLTTRLAAPSLSPSLPSLAEIYSLACRLSQCSGRVAPRCRSPMFGSRQIQAEAQPAPMCRRAPGPETWKKPASMQSERTDAEAEADEKRKRRSKPPLTSPRPARCESDIITSDPATPPSTDGNADGVEPFDTSDGRPAIDASGVCSPHTPRNHSPPVGTRPCFTAKVS